MRSARSNTTTSWPGARELLRGRQTRRGPSRRPRRACPVVTVGHLRRDPALVPRAVDDLDLDLLDGDRVLVDAEHARGLARRRAQPTGELGEVVGGVQPLDRVAPVVAVDEVVPVGDEVAERAAVVAERDAAVHAPAGLACAARRAGTARRPRASRAGAPAPGGASGVSRAHLRNPVVSPMGGFHHRVRRLVLATARLARASRDHRQHALVVGGHHLAERLDLALPLDEQRLGHRASR